jgi:teichuronic acid exporter
VNVAPAAVRPNDLTRQFASGVAWTGLAKVLSQSVAWIATLLVARYLTPTDFGLFGLAMLYLGLLQLVSDLGLGTAVLANRHTSDDDLPQINGLAALSGLAGTIFVAATAPLVGMFFNAAQLPHLLVALSPIFFITSLRTVPQTLLQREFRFKWLAFVDAFQAFALSALSIVMAMAGFGYWTLVVAALVSTLANSAIVLWRQRVPIRWPSWTRLRSMLAFSTQVVLQRIAWYLSSNADFATAGKLLGKAAAGNYMLAWNIASAPMDRVGSLILQVSPAVLGAASHDRPALKEHVLRATRLIALLIFPMCFGIALTARPFVMLFLGSRWEAAIAPLQILSAYTAVRALVPLLGQVLLVVGEEYYATRLMMVNVIVMTTAFVLGANVAGVTGIAAAYAIAHPFVASAYGARALNRVGSSAREFFVQAIWPALLCSALMAMAVLAMGRLAGGLPLNLNLASQVIIGAATYCAAAAIFFRTHLLTLVATYSARRAPAA